MPPALPSEPAQHLVRVHLQLDEQLIAAADRLHAVAAAMETDRDETMFLLRDEEDIRCLGHGALLIAGSEGVQYSIADITALDRGSWRLLERFL